MMPSTAPAATGAVPPPSVIVWDITYACPLRCTHCYSESGRRPTRQLSREDQLRVIEAMLTIGPKAIIFAGGEPLIIADFLDIARRIRHHGVQVWVHTSGWRPADPTFLRELATTCTGITISIDGATAAVHDRIRGRIGSFDRAIATLTTLDTTLSDLRRSAHPAARLGIDYVVTATNFPQLREFCATITPRFPALDTVCFGSVIPIGLASRETFEPELLTETQISELASPAFRDELQNTTAPHTQVLTTDNSIFQVHPDRAAAGEIPPAMQVEPDGAVRAMSIYEGTVGNLLDEDPHTLWNRAVQRWNDPFVTTLLRSATTQRAWAAAARQIDLHYATDTDRQRIANRPTFNPNNRSTP